MTSGTPLLLDTITRLERIPSRSSTCHWDLQMSSQASSRACRPDDSGDCSMRLAVKYYHATNGVGKYVAVQQFIQRTNAVVCSMLQYFGCPLAGRAQACDHPSSHAGAGCSCAIVWNILALQCARPCLHARKSKCQQSQPRGLTRHCLRKRRIPPPPPPWTGPKRRDRKNRKDRRDWRQWYGIQGALGLGSRALGRVERGAV